jgi:hypothetical protein
MPLSLAALLLILGGCGSSPPEPTPPTPTPTPDEILARASGRLAETNSVHFTLEVDGETYVDTAKSIRLVGAEGDLVRPDRVRATFQSEIIGRTISLQLITVGEESWTTNLLTGEWETAPVEFAYRPDVLFSTQDGIGPVMGRVQNVERLPDEEIAGRPVYHLHADVEESIVGPLTYYTVTGSPVSVDLWIDLETGDLLRARMAEPPGADRPNPAVWTLDLSNHGKELVIEPPL